MGGARTSASPKASSGSVRAPGVRESAVAAETFCGQVAWHDTDSEERSMFVGARAQRADGGVTTSVPSQMELCGVTTFE